MKTFLFFLLSLLSITISAQNVIGPFDITRVDSVYSKTLKENRKLWVYVPGTDSNSISSKQRYPVIYLLNGEVDFYPVVERIKQLSEVKGSKVVPQIMVVGISNVDRIRDFTPTHVSSEPYFDSSLLKTSGGAENFTAFLRKDLIPHIDSSYPTANYRMLIGSSLGGLLTVNTVLYHPEIFNSYVAIDPYMRWDNEILLKHSSKSLGQKKLIDRKFFLAIGNTMRKGWDTLVERKDTSEVVNYANPILRLTSFLKSSPPIGLQWSYKYYNDKKFTSVPQMAEYDALLYIFNNYKLPSFQHMLDSTFNTDSAVTVHFANFSKQVGYTVLPPEPLINELGYAFMLNKKFDKAYNLFQMNIKNYPHSFTTYNNLGDFYQVKGDKGKAIEYYTKALALRDFPSTRQKLERLKTVK